MIEPYPKNNHAKALAVLILVASFALIYHLWPLQIQDLRGQEGFYAAQAQEASKFPLVSVAHNVVINKAYVLYPALVAQVVNFFDCSIEFALRYFNVGILFVAALLAALTAANSKGFKSGCIAFAFMTSNLLVFDKLQSASPIMLTVLLVFGAQLAWFFFGMRHSKWTLAWLCSMSLIALAFLAGGFAVFMYFFIPLLLLPRPLTVWSRLRRWGFWLGLAIIVAVVTAWILAYHSVPLPRQHSLMTWPGFGEYFWEALKSPFSFFLRLLPWSLIAWAPFCSALWPLDDTPILSKYLRRILAFELAVLALDPLTETTDYILLVGPMAVLSAIYYPIAVRRYSAQIRKALTPCIYFGGLCAAALIMFCLLPDRWLTNIADLPVAEFKSDPVFIATGLSIANLILLLTFAIYIIRKNGQVYLAILMTSVIAGLSYWVLIHPYRADNHEKRELGNTLRLAIERDNPTNVEVFKMGIGDLYNECYYMNMPITKIDTADELPKDREVIYLLTTPMTEYPSHLKRQWTSLLPPRFRYLQQDLRLLKGELIKNVEKTEQVEKIEPDLKYVPSNY